MLLNHLNQAILESYTTGATISVTMEPFPLTQAQKSRRSVAGISALFTFSLGLSFIPASIISFVVKEK